MTKRKFLAPLRATGDQPHATAQPSAQDQPNSKAKKTLLVKQPSPALQKTPLPKVTFAKELEKKTQNGPGVKEPRPDQENVLVSARRVYRLPGDVGSLPGLKETGLDPFMPPYSSVMSKLPRMAVVGDGLVPLSSGHLGNLHTIAETIQDTILPCYIEHDSSHKISKAICTEDFLLGYITQLSRMESLFSLERETPQCSEISASGGLFLEFSTARPSALPTAHVCVSGTCSGKAASVATAVSSAVWVPTPQGIDERTICRQLTESTPVPLSLLKALLFP